MFQYLFFNLLYIFLKCVCIVFRINCTFLLLPWDTFQFFNSSYYKLFYRAMSLMIYWKYANNLLPFNFLINHNKNNRKFLPFRICVTHSDKLTNFELTKKNYKTISNIKFHFQFVKYSFTNWSGPKSKAFKPCPLNFLLPTPSNGKLDQ